MRYGSAALVLFISVKICMVNISYWFYLVKQWKGWQVIEASSLVDYSDVIAIQAAKVRATGRTNIVPCGVAAAAQTTATQNTLVTQDKRANAATVATSTNALLQEYRELKSYDYFSEALNLNLIRTSESEYLVEKSKSDSHLNLNKWLRSLNLN
ncbi:late embryogenesis abundant protein 47 [Tanacetum coccineum]